MSFLLFTHCSLLVGLLSRLKDSNVKLELQLLPRPTDFDVVIVVDILRMTTTSSVLVDRGLAELYVVAEEAEARQVAKERGALLLGERGGLPLPGFDGGNSPLEYLIKTFRGKKLWCVPAMVPKL